MTDATLKPTDVATAAIESTVEEQLASLAKALAEATAGRAAAEAQVASSVSAASANSASLEAALASANAAKADAEARAEAAEAAAEVAAAKADAAGVANSSHASSKERFQIIISEPRDAEDHQRVFVSPNGRGYDLARGIPIDVPWDVIEVLKNAVAGVAQMKADPLTGQPAGYSVRGTQRFPFRIVGKVVDDKGAALPEPVPVAY